MRVILLRTHYPHWGAHTGTDRFLKYVDKSAVRVRSVLVPDNHEDFFLQNTWIRERVITAIQRRGMPWYKLSDLTAEMKVGRSCVRRRIDVVHYLDGEHGAQYLPRWLRASRLTRSKTIATYHQPTTLIDGLLDPAVLSDLDHVTLVSPDQRAWFKQYLKPDRLSVILHGVDTDFFRPAGSPRQSRVFRCVSGGYWLRDWEAIRAVAERLREHRDIEFHLVTPQPTGLEALDNVIVHRHITDTGLLSVYQQCDAMLLPLKASTANNTLLEGLSCGLPVITTRLDSVCAYVRPEEGVLVDGNDRDILADAVLYLKRHPGARERLGAAARQRARELDWRNVAAQYESLYISVLA
jgi:glycosyltransferase involved in cell wall biosynthesis